MYAPNQRLIEASNLVAGIIPVDLQSGANAGDWVSLKDYERVQVIVFKAAGTAGDDPVITMKQATDVSGVTNKALNFTDVWSKVGTQTSVGTFTHNTQAAGNTYTDTVSAEAQGIFVLEFKAEDLDVDGGYDCLQVSIPDTGTNAQLGCALYLLYGARYAKGTEPSAIVD